VQELLFQEERPPLPLADLDLREMVLMTVLALVCLWMGIHPAPLLDLIHLPVQLLTGGGL
jgi:NADH-quinone oxidoreductase subunit M